jgi:guanosine-3',5'-bis(diphosphate) 3'-pyrophosphohydrolase
MLLAMVNDVRVVLVKLADRLHNMRTLQYLDSEKQQRIARETLDIYAPVANRLGMGLIRGELEDLSFRYLEPEAFFELQKKISSKQKVFDKFLVEVQEMIRGKLVEKRHSRRGAGPHQAPLFAAPEDPEAAADTRSGL